jgi:predicted RNA-binding protein with RPS1 domain
MPPFRMPPPGAIEPGVICRVEAYGAFCQLTNFGCRGLIHISQLANHKVEQVEDVLAVDDQVWVKVLSVEEDVNHQQPGRFKVSLSFKDASQDGTGQDLGAQRDQQDLMTSKIEQNLNSSIGMAVARDPMDSRLIMKHKGSSFHGYSLVGEDEGEPESAAVVPIPPSETRLAPVGRGRGATLPAWMTKAPDGPTGADSGDDGSKDGTRKIRKEKKKKEHKHSKSGPKHRRRHRHDDSDSEDSEDSYRKRHRKGRKRSRSHDGKKRSRDKDRKDRKRDREDEDVSEASGDNNDRGDRKHETGTSGADRNKSSRRKREGSRSREDRGERKTRGASPDSSGEHRHGRKHRRGRSESYSNDNKSSSIGRKLSRSRERGNDVERGPFKEKGSTPTVL